MCEALVWWVFAERLPITQRLWANKSLNMTMWPAFKCLCPTMGGHLSPFILQALSSRDLPDPRQINFISLQLRSLQEILLSPNL